MSDESFAKSLFSGLIVDAGVFPFPEPTRSEADQLHVLFEAFRKLAVPHVDGAALDRTGEVPEAVLAAFRELGLFGLLVPKAHGGLGLSTTAAARVIQEIAGYDTALAMMVAAHQSPSLRGILELAGDDLEARHLPRLAKGEGLAAFALTEEGAGSDAAGILTRADADGDAYVLHGEKIWVTNGGLADVFIVFARTSPAEDGAKPRLTAFLVEKNERVHIGPNEPKLGVRALSTTRVRFDDVRVPTSAVLGEVGRGFKVATELLTHGRLTLAAACVGASKKLLRMTVERSLERKAFGRTLSEFGLTKDKIALMTSELFALESVTYLTTGLVDAGKKDFAVESAITKVLASETLWRIANEAAQVAAGSGYAGDAPWERLLRDARVHLVNEGTNEILRCFIALSGMQAQGKRVEEVGRAMREPIKGFGLLSDLATRTRSALFPERGERLSRASPVLSRETALFEQHTENLAKNVDKVLRRHGKNIAEMQYAQRRIADTAIDLYALAAVIARTTRAIERRGEEGARREIDLASVFASAAAKRLAETALSFDENDDELRKSIASKTCADGAYPLDVI